MNESPRISLNASATLVAVDYSGHVTAQAMQAHAGEVDALAGQVKPGFVVLTDLTQLDSMDPECAPVLSRIMDQFNRFKVGRVIRIIPDPKKDIGLGILSLFHYQREIPVNTVKTKAEAQRLL